MGLFSRLLGGRKSADTGSPESGAGVEPAQRTARVAYDPALIAKLKADHAELQRTFAAVQRAAADGRFHDIHHLLSHFRQLFQAHIATENARFYPYLWQTVAQDAGTASLIAETRRETNGLGFEVLTVVDAYLAYPPNQLTETQFTYDLQRAGAQLEKRVGKTETQLYSLYRG